MVISMKYAIYFYWNDGETSSINVKDAKTRNKVIKEAKKIADIIGCAYSFIYKSGEYAKRVNAF